MSIDEAQNDIHQPWQRDRWDVIEVVRCEYCRNWYAFPDKKFGYCRRECWDDEGQYRLKVETNHDDYCSYGVRKDGN